MIPGWESNPRLETVNLNPKHSTRGKTYTKFILKQLLLHQFINPVKNQVKIWAMMRCQQWCITLSYMGQFKFLRLIYWSDMAYGHFIDSIQIGRIWLQIKVAKQWPDSLSYQSIYKVIPCRIFHSVLCYYSTPFLILSLVFAPSCSLHTTRVQAEHASSDAASVKNQTTIDDIVRLIHLFKEPAAQVHQSNHYGV